MKRIPLSFFRRQDVVTISQSLIGKYILTCFGPDQITTGGMITETEAYCGVEDKASHAYNNRRTKRTETMFAEGGVVYVYLCYGLHHLLNIVTNKRDIPHAILIRAFRPEIGIEEMLKRRKKHKLTHSLTNGPGTVCQALGIDKTHDGLSVNGTSIWLEDRGVIIPLEAIEATPRIGVDYAGEDAFKPWRFKLSKNWPFEVSFESSANSTPY